MAIEQLVDELERSYAETQERASDPSIYNDHRQAADVGRRLKELETPKRLADEWRQVREDLDAARGDSELAGMTAELEAELERLEGELRLALVETDPADEQGRDRRDPTGRRRETRPRSGAPTSTACSVATRSDSG